MTKREKKDSGSLKKIKQIKPTNYNCQMVTANLLT
uniref:Uncharacterized protein n=1 Tax=Rhizophora mucronata TaxID=61149 RepID=A0A2P2L8P1_RHIMU